MAEQHWIPANYHSSEWAAVLREKYSSVNFPLDAPAEARFLRSPPSSPSQADWSPPDGFISKKHQDAYSGRKRPAFRRENGHHSDGKTASVPNGMRPPFR